MQAELKVVEGRQQGAVIPLAKKKFLIGREEDCQLRPNSDLVSRHHCAFTVDDYSVRLRDLGSTNGTFVNGERITGQVILNDGDEVRVGKLAFQLVVRASATIPVAAAVASAETHSAAPSYSSPAAPPASETLTDMPVAPVLPVEEETSHDFAAQQTQVFSGDTSMMPPTRPKRPKMAPIPVRLPDPEETGAKPVVAAPPPAPAPEGSAPPPSDPRKSAAEIIRQYRQQRPTT